MSQPTRGDVHVNRPLTNMSVAFIQDASDFVAGQVFPAVPVMKQGDRYFQYAKKQWYRSNARKRAPGTESAGGGFDIDNTPSYFADVFAIHKDVDDQTRANADQPINLDRDASEWVAQQLLLKREKEFVSTYFTTSIWTGSTTGSDISVSTKWDSAGSDPVDDVEAEKDAMREKTGKKANVMVVVPAVFRALKNNASILDRFKHTQKGILTEDLLAEVFGVDKFLVAYATEDEAEEGQTESMDYVFGDEGALLVHAAPRPGIMIPSAGYVFNWTGLFGAAGGMRTKRFRIEKEASDRIEGEMAWDMKLVAAQLGVFFSDVLT